MKLGGLQYAVCRNQGIEKIAPMQKPEEGTGDSEEQEVARNHVAEIKISADAEIFCRKEDAAPRGATCF